MAWKSNHDIIELFCSNFPCFWKSRESKFNIILGSFFRDSSYLAYLRINHASESSLNSVSKNKNVNFLIFDGCFLDRKSSTTEWLFLKVSIRFLFGQKFLKLFNGSLKKFKSINFYCCVNFSIWALLRGLRLNLELNWPSILFWVWFILPCIWSFISRLFIFFLIITCLISLCCRCIEKSSLCSLLPEKWRSSWKESPFRFDVWRLCE